jgi:hypothetical protein
MRARVGPDRPILVYHEDLPLNDFNSLFKGLASGNVHLNYGKNVEVASSNSTAEKAVFREIKSRINAIAPPLASLLLSDLLTILADMVGYITLPWWIVHQGGAHDLALYSVSIAITTIFAMPLLSPLGDRYAKRAQIVWGSAS